MGNSCRKYAEKACSCSAFHQPVQDRVWIDLEHPRRAPEAQAFGQTRDDAHDELHRGVFAMKNRAKGFVEIPVTGDTRQLPPKLAAGMPMGAAGAAAAPAVVGTIGVWTEVRVRIDSPSAPSGEAEDRR